MDFSQWQDKKMMKKRSQEETLLTFTLTKKKEPNKSKNKKKTLNPALALYCEAICKRRRKARQNRVRLK